MLCVPPLLRNARPRPYACAPLFVALRDHCRPRDHPSRSLSHAPRHRCLVRSPSLSRSLSRSFSLSISLSLSLEKHLANRVGSGGLPLRSWKTGQPHDLTNLRVFPDLEKGMRPWCLSRDLGKLQRLDISMCVSVCECFQDFRALQRSSRDLKMLWDMRFSWELMCWR